MAYFYALIFILAGLIFYIPFVYYKKVFPGIGKKIMPISSQRILLLLLTKNYRFHNKVHTKMFYGWSNCKRIRD